MTNPPSRHQDDVSHDLGRLLRRLADDGGDQGLTLHQIRDRLDERAYGLLILILSIPCLVPGLYGVPQAVGFIIILVAAQLLLGREERGGDEVGHRAQGEVRAHAASFCLRLSGS